MSTTKDPSSPKRPGLSRNHSSQSAQSAAQPAGLAPNTSKSATTDPPKSASQDSPDASQDDIIDMDIFQQILELDDDDPEHTFSRETIEDYFNQVKSTFENMDNALREQDLSQLSSLGHFLKGSSAALGLKKVQQSCEEMQNVGNLKDEAGNSDISEAEALERIKVILKDVKTNYGEAEEWLKNYFKVK